MPPFQNFKSFWHFWIHSFCYVHRYTLFLFGTERVLGRYTYRVKPGVSSAYMAALQGRAFLINLNTMKVYSTVLYLINLTFFAIDEYNFQFTNDVDTFFQQRNQYMGLLSSYCYL